MKKTLFSATIAICIFTAILASTTGCGKKEAATEGTPGVPAGAPAGAPGGLTPQAQSAMQAQQKAEADSRAAHAPPGPK